MIVAACWSMLLTAHLLSHALTINARLCSNLKCAALLDHVPSIGGEGHGGKQRRTAACLRPTADLLCWHILIHHATASWVRSNEIEIERESLRERRKREGPHQSSSRRMDCPLACSQLVGKHVLGGCPILLFFASCCSSSWN